MSKTRHAPITVKRPAPLRVGFVPLNDCAPLVMARELGLFAKYDVAVELKRELGWATIRDKIIFGELDAAHAVAGMPFAVSLGLGSSQCDCVVGMVLSLHGNAITLSRELWDAGVRDARTLRERITKSRAKHPPTFGVVFPSSSHNFLLRQWLADAGIDPNRDVRIVVVPPPQMVANLRAGNLDGYCVGEPWNSLAVQSKAGCSVAVSAQLAPGHPEKVLLVRRTFAETRTREHLALMAALLEACAFCDQWENAEFVASVLSRPEYLNLPAAAVGRSLCGLFEFGCGRTEAVPDFHVFHRDDANDPSREKAAWITRSLLRHGLVSNRSVLESDAVGRIFRPDLFRQARAMVAGGKPTKKISEPKLVNA
jgi:ABC-type nitrate/sulfonate/bicarbonate transport system substrate-binding protein